MIQRPRRIAAGFSLVEMIAAIAIFSVGVLATMEVFTMCLRSTSASLGQTRAVFLAQQALEETLAESALRASSESGDFAPQFPRYAWMREIEETEQAGLYRLQVAVTWDERGRERRYTLTTLIAERQ